jgi:hypothetical protein
MKPHEETWENGRDYEVTVCGPELDRDIDAPRERLARAAPAMARALLDVLYRRGNCDTRERAARTALREAGVLE